MPGSLLQFFGSADVSSGRQFVRMTFRQDALQPLDVCSHDHLCIPCPVLIAQAISSHTVSSCDIITIRNIVKINIVLSSKPFPPTDLLIHMVWPVTRNVRSVSRCQTNCCRLEGSTPFPAKAAAARLPYRGLVWSGMLLRGQICRVGRGWRWHPHAMGPF